MAAPAVDGPGPASILDGQDPCLSLIFIKLPLDGVCLLWEHCGEVGSSVEWSELSRLLAGTASLSQGFIVLNNTVIPESLVFLSL